MILWYRLLFLCIFDKFMFILLSFRHFFVHFVCQNPTNKKKQTDSFQICLRTFGSKFLFLCQQYKKLRDFFHRFYCHFNSSLQNNFFTLRRTKVIAKPTAPLLRSSRIRPIRNFAHMLRYSCRYIRQIDAVLCAGT